MTNADKFKHLFGIYATELWVMPESDFLEWLNADAQDMPTGKRKTGYWILHSEQEKNIFGVKQIECSECGDKCLVQFVEKEKYCRNCGAKMEGARSEDIPMEYFESGGR